MDRLKGVIYAIVSSTAFGLAPFFSITLLAEGFTSFEVLTYRWGVAAIALFLLGIATGVDFRVKLRDFPVVIGLGLMRAITSLSLITAYINIASGVASTIHFMYPLAVALTMMFVFNERKSMVILIAIATSLAGAFLLSSGDLAASDGNPSLGLACAVVSVFSYAGYIVGVRKSRAVNVSSIALTCYVMSIGSVLFFACGAFTSGIRIVTDLHTWSIILGLSLVATALSNFSLVKAIKKAGPTLTSILGAMEPITAVVIGVAAFNEAFTVNSAIGIFMILASVMIVLHRQHVSNKMHE